MSHTAAATSQAPAATSRRSRWPLVGAAAGLTGTTATLATDVRGPEPVSEANFLEVLSRPTYHVSVVAGYATVALLLVLAAQWRRRVEPRVRHSTAAHVVPLGLVTAAAALCLGYGWKGAMAIYLPGGLNAGLYDRAGLYVYYLLNDFGSFIGWLGVTVTAGAVACMALRERTISRWIGVISLLPVLSTAAYVALTGLPGAPGLTGSVWLLVAFTGLALGRSTISR